MAKYYDPEFKLEAVKRVEQSGVSVAKISSRIRCKRKYFAWMDQTEPRENGNAVSRQREIESRR